MTWKKNGWKFLLAVLAAVVVLAVGVRLFSGGQAGGELTCTLSVSGAAVLNHPELCDADTLARIPADGLLLPSTQAAFSEGETPFDVLKRVCAEQSLPMEHASSPFGAYVEGIDNLYTGDVGSASGWLYAVNGETPEAACDAYTLKDGDEVLWFYICDYEQDLAAILG